MSKGWRILLKTIGALIALGLVVYLGMLGVLIWRVQHLPPAEDYGAIIVLGAQVKPDGTPNVQLQWRLDAALSAWEAHPCPVVVCGAQGIDEPRAEGLVMRDYLLERGVPEHRVLADIDSFNTRENLRNAAALLGKNAPEQVLVVTSDYHLPRALSLAEEEGFDACGLGSPTLGGFHRVKNYARETIAWLKLYAERLLGIEIGSGGIARRTGS
ncbi:MAG: YdcF family protein [Clostridia bacterium]|nr:YdcF family protein [Clostridia bacterium]